MKTNQLFLGIATIVLFVTNTNAQLNISINGFEDDESQNVIFRGFNNVLELTQSDEEFEYTIETDGLISSRLIDTDTPNSKRYIVKAGHDKVVTLKFRKKGETQVFQTLNCQVANFPDPYIYFGGVPNGGEISKSTSDIAVRHSMKVRYKASYYITKFSIAIADEVLTSDNGEITDEMRKYLEQSVSGEVVTLNCYVSSSDGITRLMGADYTVK